MSQNVSFLSASTASDTSSDEGIGYEQQSNTNNPKSNYSYNKIFVTETKASEEIDQNNQSLQSKFLSYEKKFVIFHDMVHSHIELPNLCYKIINTPQFQRLRNLKQLGLAYHVYPSASHNRFEHCIGTSYLAGKYGQSLQKRQPELGITEIDILCLFIAGLCHDLGHGPFSHTWEIFMKKYNPQYSHEVMSIRMIDFMIKENNLWKHFLNEGLDEIDLIFIKELILGHSLKNNADLLGRGPEKYFLYQIVSNEESKIDVDKFDYLLRDSKMLNVKTSFEYERVIDNSHVYSKPDNPKVKTLCYRKKIAENLQDLFKGRFRMHQVGYQHKTNKIIEQMVLDGLHAAELHFKISGLNGNQYSLSTAFNDLYAFMKLTDAIFDMILYWNDLPQSDAKLIFSNILKRNLYKSFGFITAQPKENLLKELLSIDPRLILVKSKINFGKGDDNPLNFAWFYEKSRPGEIFKTEFPPPNLENKCYILVKTLKEDSNNNTSLLKSTSQIKYEIYKWAEKQKISIQSE